MVEIMPEGFLHKGFRNLAGAMGHGYYSAHGQPSRVESQSQAADVDTQAQQQKRGSQWQTDDVVLERDRMLELMDVAIKSLYNTGPYNFDVT
jgi:protein O-GlcNAc transferase